MPFNFWGQLLGASRARMLEIALRFLLRRDYAAFWNALPPDMQAEFVDFLRAKLTEASLP